MDMILVEGFLSGLRVHLDKYFYEIRVAKKFNHRSLDDDQVSPRGTGQSLLDLVEFGEFQDNH